MLTRSDLDTVNKAMRGLDTGYLIGVPAAIGTLLRVPKPKGDPARVRELAGGCKAAASGTDSISVQVANVTHQDLPEVWVGTAVDKAGDVLVAVAEDLRYGAGVLTQANTVLQTFADGLEDAHWRYTNAQDPLYQAKTATDAADYGEGGAVSAWPEATCSGRRSRRC
jgi:hypothetical protein